MRWVQKSISHSTPLFGWHLMFLKTILAETATRRTLMICFTNKISSYVVFSASTNRPMKKSKKCHGQNFQQSFWTILFKGPKMVWNCILSSSSEIKTFSAFWETLLWSFISNLKFVWVEVQSMLINLHRYQLPYQYPPFELLMPNWFISAELIRSNEFPEDYFFSFFKEYWSS